MGLTPALSRAVHDVNARLGSILIAVSAVAELDLDGETRKAMLTTASGETIRSSAELAAIVALTVCALDDTDPDALDLSAALATAADIVRLHGIDVEAGEPAPAVVRAAAVRVEAGLPALLRIVAGASKCVSARVAVEGDRLHLYLARAKPEQDPEALPPVVQALVEELGARREESDAFACSWPVVTP